MSGLRKRIEPGRGQGEIIETECVRRVRLRFRDCLAPGPHLRGVRGGRRVRTNFPGTVHDRTPHPFSVKQATCISPATRRRVKKSFQLPLGWQAPAIEAQSSLRLGRGGEAADGDDAEGHEGEGDNSGGKSLHRSLLEGANHTPHRSPSSESECPRVSVTAPPWHTLLSFRNRFA